MAFTTPITIRVTTAIPIAITTAVQELTQPKRQASTGTHMMMPMTTKEVAKVALKFALKFVDRLGRGNIQQMTTTAAVTATPKTKAGFHPPISGDMSETPLA
jgi:hypothetical protein